MKLSTKILTTLSALLVSGSATSFAATALHTDIVTYINHYALPSYAVNGQSVIVAEDLANFGFNVQWDGNSRSLNISRNSTSEVKGMSTVDKSYIPGTKFADVIDTDIQVYANGVRLTSYSLNGYTMVPIEELNVFGDVYWVESERAVKLWVNGLHSLATPQEVKITPIELINIYGQNASVLPKDYNAYVNAGWYTYSDFIIAYTNRVLQNSGVVKATEYLQSKFDEGGFAVTQQHQDLLASLYSKLYNQYKVPILITDTDIEYSGNDPDLAYINFWNISGKDIDYFVIDFSCYDSFGNLDTSYYNGHYEGWVNNAQFARNSTEWYSWSLDGFPRTSTIKNIIVTNVSFTDGTTWSR